MSIDEQQHVALPKLYGAPAYARPLPIVDATPRPFDPDELPDRGGHDRRGARHRRRMPARAYGTGPHGAVMRRAPPAAVGATIGARPFSLREIAGRLLGGRLTPADGRV